MNKIEKILGANIAICDGSDCCESEEVGVLIFADLPELIGDYNISVVEVEWQDEAAPNSERPKCTC